MSDKILWFGIGALAAYLIGKAGAGAHVGFSVDAGADTRTGYGRTYRGAQYPAPYSPLGTVGGFPANDPGGFGGVFDFGAAGNFASWPVGYQDQFPAQSNGAFDPKGVSVDGNSYAGCLTASKA